LDKVFTSIIVTITNSKDMDRPCLNGNFFSQSLTDLNDC